MRFAVLLSALAAARSLDPGSHAASSRSVRDTKGAQATTSDESLTASLALLQCYASSTCVCTQIDLSKPSLTGTSPSAIGECASLQDL